MNKKEIASTLSHIATLLELNHENSFKIKAFSSASRILQTSELESEQILEQVREKKIKGIGPQISECIISLYETGSAKALDSIKGQFSREFLELLELPGLGAKKLKTLKDKLGIENIDALEKACNDGTIDSISGFGKKTQSNFLKAIALHKEYKELSRFDEALFSTKKLIAELKIIDGISKVEITGELRRKLELITCSEILISLDKQIAIDEIFSSLSSISNTQQLEKDKFLLTLEDNSKVNIYICEENNFLEKLFFTTGSKSHLDIVEKKIKNKTPFISEKEFYSSASLPFIPAELREGKDEFSLGSYELIKAKDIKGVIHSHSTYSDGADSLENMALAAIKKGYAYLGITDHSRTASYAGGLSIEDVQKQHEEIDTLNEKLAPFKILKGIESDILIDGSLDYPDSILSTFDFVIASVHSGFSKDKKKMTTRIITAIENPFCTILGHLTGRLLLMREGYGLDIDTILEAAAKNNVAIELNCSPKRLDLDWRFHSKATKLGIRIPICPDAHSTKAIDYIQDYGIGIARKGGLKKEDVPNAWDLKTFESFLKERR